MWIIAIDPRGVKITENREAAEGRSLQAVTPEEPSRNKSDENASTPWVVSLVVLLVKNFNGTLLCLIQWIKLVRLARYGRLLFPIPVTQLTAPLATCC